MITNMPVLYQNIMDGLRTEAGKDAFLWATEQKDMDPMLYRAERFAHECEQVGDVVWQLLKIGFQSHGCSSLAAKIDLHTFIMRRHCHHSFPGKNEAWI